MARPLRSARRRLENWRLLRTGDKPKDIRTRATRLQQWRDLLSISGVRFINLQHGDCGNELSKTIQDCGVELHAWPDADNRNDLDCLAAQIAALDLVISVGNANIHLAGALGVPAWSMLPVSWRMAVAPQCADHELVSKRPPISSAAPGRLDGGCLRRSGKICWI